MHLFVWRVETIAAATRSGPALPSPRFPMRRGHARTGRRGFPCVSAAAPNPDRPFPHQLRGHATAVKPVKLASPRPVTGSRPAHSSCFPRWQSQPTASRAPAPLPTRPSAAHLVLTGYVPAARAGKGSREQRAGAWGHFDLVPGQPCRVLDGAPGRTCGTAGTPNLSTLDLSLAEHTLDKEHEYSSYPFQKNKKYSRQPMWFFIKHALPPARNICRCNDRADTLCLDTWLSLMGRCVSDV
jgi:hypothetical protein